METEHVHAVAVEQGATRDFEPIPLAVDGVTYGAIYDRFRLIALASRAAARKGQSLDPKKLPAWLGEAGDGDRRVSADVRGEDVDGR